MLQRDFTRSTIVRVRAAELARNASRHSRSGLKARIATTRECPQASPPARTPTGHSARTPSSRSTLVSIPAPCQPADSAIKAAVPVEPTSLDVTADSAGGTPR